MEIENLLSSEKQNNEVVKLFHLKSVLNVPEHHGSSIQSLGEAIYFTKKRALLWTKERRRSVGFEESLASLNAVKQPHVKLFVFVFEGMIFFFYTDIEVSILIGAVGLYRD